MKHTFMLLTALLLTPLVTLHATETDSYFGLSSLKCKPSGFFRLTKTRDRHHLVTPDGHAFIALGINHLAALQQPVESGLRVRGDTAWQIFWDQKLRPQFADWHMTTLGYGAPAALKAKAPWFATIQLAAIEKHRSDPKRVSRDAYHFPDVFDPAWVTDVTARITKVAAPLRDDSFVIGYFWTDTPTWDLIKTRALRGTDWVSALRALPPGSAGRQTYATFLESATPIASAISTPSTAFPSPPPVSSTMPISPPSPSAAMLCRRTTKPSSRQIAQCFYDVVGKAQRRADPNHLVFGDRYLAGDAPECVLKAAKPWIDAVAVQPGDRYSPLYPASTHFPEAEIDLLHAITGKPVLICDHAISFPTAEHPRTIFEQMPDEAAAARATADFLQAAFAKPYMLGYLRCQYIDRPASHGRGLRQGVLQSDGAPRAALVRVYREGFAAAIESLKDVTP